MDTAMASIFAVRRWCMSTTRRSFTAEFTAEAVRQVTELGRLLSQVARELSLRPAQLRGWKQQLVARGAVPAPVRVETAAEEVRRLRRELAGLRQERAFLGKAAACFASGPARGTP
jgi:transposase